ncbi:methyltransferase domain-containing protein [Methanoculleus caldifontis]|uniref:methyltransferase domain-containing protein n=1 Tax=Methanoculleus caldifontis TaxID=2651577 RepID=UPI002936DFF9|nr:methyltransferase domain-containing protein [Methanoculleus sp. Wushi-C6]
MAAGARENVAKGGQGNVEFRPGKIEHLPVADNSVGAVPSNCVTNLSTDRSQVFREALRVLRPEGGSWSPISFWRYRSRLRAQPAAGRDILIFQQRRLPAMARSGALVRLISGGAGR